MILKEFKLSFSMNIILSVANFCLQCCWLEAGGSTESVITATAPPTTNNHRSFQNLSPTLPADTLEAGRTVRVMHQMKKIQKTRLQYAKIRWEAFRSGEHGT